MTLEEVQKFEAELEEHGYTKITSCKSVSTDEYEWYKPFRGENDEIQYQIFFQFWNFGKYRIVEPEHEWSVSVCVMPDSCRFSIEWSWLTDIEKVEKTARGFNDFIASIEKG